MNSILPKFDAYPKFKQTNKLTNKVYPQKKRLVDYIEHTVIKQDSNPRFLLRREEDPCKKIKITHLYQRKKSEIRYFLFLIILEKKTQ